MSSVGIIAEFDPFHRGHEYLIRRAKEMEPEAAVVVAMSGHFTQRGGPAAVRPLARAEMALRCGADLVLELPLPWAVSSAEGFGYGGAAVLYAAGVESIAFGSESGDAERLRRAAECLKTDEYRRLLKEGLGRGVSFAQARQEAVTALMGEDVGGVLSSPNDLLGVSYLAALDRLGAEVRVHALRRVGPEHNAGRVQDGYTSASAIRERLQNGKLDEALELLPEPVRPILRREWENGLAPASLRHCERAVLYRLRSMDEAEFRKLPDCSEGLENRLIRAVNQAASLEECYALAKTKRYAHSRLRRLCLWAFLGMTAEDRPEALPYLRVLGMTGRGREHLHSIKKSCPVPILTRPAAGKRLPPEAKRLLALEMRGADLWGMCLRDLRPAGEGWKESAVMVDR